MAQLDHEKEGLQQAQLELDILEKAPVRSTKWVYVPLTHHVSRHPLKNLRETMGSSLGTKPSSKRFYGGMNPRTRNCSIHSRERKLI